MTKKQPNDLEIKHLGKGFSDEETVKALHKVVTASFQGESPWTVDHLRHSLEADNALVFEATHLDEKIGLIVASETPYEIDIYMVVVAEEYKQQGIGTQLFTYLIEYAQAKNIESVVLETRKSNLPAIALYERVGFKKVGERKAYYSSPIEDAIIMKHEL